MVGEAKEEITTRASTKMTRSSTLLYVLGAIAALLLIVAIFLAYKLTTTSAYMVPDYIKKNATHSIYIPRKLPNGYKIAEGSFMMDEAENTLLFRAEDSSGSSIAFTEQKRPQDFDFEKFYQEQMEGAKKLDGTPYPSVFGRAPTGDRFLLSIVTDDTWILASTAAPLNEQDFTLIAKNIKKD
jgi:hypothetical protein